MPAPFGPIRPMRSPRITRVEKIRSDRPVAPAKPLAMPLASNTSLPDCSACSTCRRTLPICSRRAARSARIASSALTRPSFLRPPRLDALAHPHFLFGELLVELVREHLLVGERLFLAPQVGGVVARPRRQLAAIELDDPRRQPLEERAVVGDEHHGAFVLGEKALEPLDRLDVEVVGRLVEQQQIRLADQRARQQHAPAPSARQRVDDRVRRQLEPRQDQLDVVLAQPGLVLFEMVRVPFGDDVEDRAVRGQRHVLLEARDRAATAGATPCRRRARISPLRIFSSVDLPVPLRPITDTRSRASICIATSSSSGR